MHSLFVVFSLYITVKIAAEIFFYGKHKIQVTFLSAYFRPVEVYSK